jgi:hypothetical protein
MKGANMASQVGYEYVKTGVAFLFTAIATGITLVKKKDEIIAEIKDTQLDEVVGLVTVEVREGITKVVAAIAS